MLPSFFVSPSDTKDEFKTHIFQSLLLQAIAGLVCQILCIFLLKHKPPTPPSPSAGQTSEMKFGPSIRALFTNKDLVCLIFVFGLVQGSFNTYGTLVDFLSSSYGYTSDNSSLFGALFVVGGIVGAAAIGIFVEKTLRYKMAVWFICISSTLLNIGCKFVMPKGNILSSSILFFFVGFSMVPILAVSFDFGVELTYPIGESMSTGVLLSASQIVGVIQISICSYLID